MFPKVIKRRGSMKKYLIILLMFCLCILIGCNKEPNVYSINYDLNGGECENLITSFEEGTDVFLPTPEKEGYTFDGWYQNDLKITVIEDKDYSLFAKWIINTYTISYDLDGGKCDNLIDVFEHNQKVTLPTPTKEGYIFNGWYQNEEKIESIENRNYNLVAKWEAENVSKSFNVKIHFNGKIIFNGSVLEGTRLMDIDLSSKINSKFTYQLEKMYLDENLEDLINIRTKVIEDLEVYSVITLKPKLPDFKNLKISILGDSISTFYKADSEVNSYYSEDNSFYYPRYCSVINSYTKTWWWKVIEGLEANIGINNSWSGTCVYNWGSSTNSSAMNMHRIETLDENGTPDIIIINMGTNDAVNNFTDDIFYSAYDTMISRIEEKYPNAYIFCFNLGYSVYEGFNPVRLRYNEVINKVATKHEAILVDIAYIQTESTYSVMLADRLHPNEEGMNRISERAITTIKAFFNYGKEFK